MDITALRNELVTDGAAASPPIIYSDGIPWMDQAKAEADLALLLVVDRASERAFVTAAQLDEAIDEDEDGALAGPQARAVDRVFQVAAAEGSVDIRAGTKARAKLEFAFAPGPTRTALGALLNITVSRAEEIGLVGVHVGDIQNARDLS